MTRITPEDLHDRLDAILGRTEAGEEFTIVVDGRSVAQLGPPERRRWVSGAALRAILAGPALTSMADDLEQFPGGSFRHP